MSYATLGDSITTKRLAAQTTRTTVTPAIVTGLSLSTEVGVYTFKYYLIYRSTNTNTGVRFDVNYTGTVTNFVWIQRWVDVSATASTAAPDQDEIIAAGGVIGGFSSRAKGTAGRGTTLSVDTANADMLMILEGIMVVTVAGSLDLYFAGETTTSVSLEAGSALVVTPIA
jgi:hypothetical protein